MTYNTLIFFHGQRINPLKIQKTGHWSVNTMAEMDVVTYVVHQRWRRRDAIGISKPSISHLHPQTQDLRNHTGVLSKKKIRSPNNQRSENKIDFKDQLSLLHQPTEKASTPHLTIAANGHK